MGADYSDIRFDNNADGIIDQWHIEKGPTVVEIYFKLGKIDGVDFYTTKNNFRMRISYKIEKELLSLASSSAQKNSIYHQHKEIQSDAGIECSLRNLLEPIQFAKLKMKLESSENEDKWAKINLENCQNESASIIVAAKKVFQLSLKDNAITNQYLNCVAASQDAKIVTPAFIARSLAGPNHSPPIKIICEKTTGPHCGQASYNPETGAIHLPISDPPCRANMVDVYSDQIFHEGLHSLKSNPPESQIATLEKTCGKSDKESKPLQPEKHSEIGVKSIHEPPAATEQAAGASDQQQVTQIPATIEVDSIMPGAPAGYPSGSSALNASFVSADSPSAIPSEKAYVSSQQTSAPILATANRIFRSAVPAANAASVASKPATAGEKRSPASSDGLGTTQSRLPIVNLTKAPDSAPAKANLFAKTTNTAFSGSKSTTIPDSGTSVESAAPNLASERSPFSKKSNGPQQAIRPPTSSRPQNSARAVASTNGAASNETQVLATLTESNPKKALEYAAANEAELRKYRILVMDRVSNRTLGHQDPNTASRKLVPDGRTGKLVSEGE